MDISQNYKTPETRKLFCSTMKLIDKIKDEENVPSLEVIEVVLVQCNLVDNRYQQQSEVLYTFTPNKSYAYLLNVKRRNLLIKMVDGQKQKTKLF